VKTISLKKVSAVAVASLGFGLLSVVPAQAAAANGAITTSLGTVTPAAPIVGSPVVIQLKAAKVVDTAGDGVNIAISTAAFVTQPANSALVSATSIVSTLTNVDAKFSTAGTTASINTVSANTIITTMPALSAVVTPAAIMGQYTFTPDVPGTYVLSILTTNGAGAVAIAAATNTATADLVITVGGAQLTQATSGKGAITGTATTGGSAVVAFSPAVATGANATFNIVSTGVGAVTNPQGCASLDATLTANVVRCVNANTATGQAVAALNGTNFADGIRYTSPTAVVNGTGELVTAAAAKNGTMTFDASSSVAGTQVITITGISIATGAPTVVASVTIVWGATPVTAASLSTSFICAGAVVTDCAGPDATIKAAKTASTTAATRIAGIKVVPRNSAGTDLTNTATLTVVVTGPGSVGIAANAGENSQGRAITGTAGENFISVHGDGTAGTSTITISLGTTVLATETVIFFGSVAKVTAVQGLKIATAGGATLGNGTATIAATFAGTPAVVLTLADSNGNVVPSQNAALSAVSSDATVMSSTIVSAEDDATLTGAGAGTYNVQVSSAAGSVSGKSATLTFRFAVGDGTFISSAPVTFSTGKATVATVTMAFDKSSYNQGDAAVLTITGKDSLGNPVADGLQTGLFTATPVYSKTANGSLPTTAITFIGGVATFKQFAPASSGSFNVSATVNPLVADAAASVSAASSVVDGNAAIATSIASLNAKIVALNALIAKIMKRLNIK
jgi:trimeric autotransporter adhesin